MAMIAPPPLGSQEVVGLGKETTWNTAITGAGLTAWLRPLSNSLGCKDPYIATAGATGVSVRNRYHGTLPRVFKGTPDVSGQIAYEPTFADIGTWLVSALEDPGSAGSGPYTHTFNMEATPNATMPSSLTIGRVHGLAAEHRRYSGCCVNRMELSGAPGRLVTATMDIIGGSQQAIEDLADDVTAGEFSTAPFLEFHHSALTIGSVGSTTIGTGTAETGGEAPLDWTVTIENNLRAVQAVNGAIATIGTRAIREPIYNGYRTARITVNRDFFSDDFLDLAYDTAMTGGFVTAELSLYVSASYSLRCFMPAALIQDYAMPAYAGGAEPLRETVTFEAAVPADGTTAPFTVQLINATATY